MAFLALRTKYITLSFLLITAQQLQCFSSRPNIVILMVDDLGIADLGCFGNDSIKTPNIDKLATQGVRLTHSLSSESICTPSRAAFLTGRYAVRSGLAAGPNNVRILIHTSVPGGLPRNETTFATVLSNAGYSTGLIGKWHLGLNKEFANDFHYHPLNHGFDFFYGMPFTNYIPCGFHSTPYDNMWYLFSSLLVITSLMCGARLFISTKAVTSILVALILSCVLTLYRGIELDESGFPRFQGQMDCFLMKNLKVVEQPILLENMTVRLTNEAVGFITRKHQSSSPFLLFMSYLKVHTPLFTSKTFKGSSGHSRYSDNVEELDWSVGRIMDNLDDLGIRNNTFVYFTSDHGPDLKQIINGEYHGGWKGHFKGGKGHSWDGGIRVPSLVSWPSQIPENITINEPTISVDMYPTIVHLAGATLPNDRVLDGNNILPLLKQQVEYSPTEFMFHYCAQSLQAVRYRPRHGVTVWKAVFVTPKYLPSLEWCSLSHRCSCYGDDAKLENPPLLYDITADPSERFPLSYNDSSYESIMQIIVRARKDHERTIEHVPNQLDNNYWFLWRQTCCNYPFCWCKES